MKSVRVFSNKYLYTTALSLVAVIMLFTFGMVIRNQNLAQINADDTNSDNPYIIEQLVNGDWEEVHRAIYETEYSTQEFSLVSNSTDLRLRIQRTGGDFADLEQVSLFACGQKITPDSADYVDGSGDVLDDLLEDDLNVVIAQDKQIEIDFTLPPTCLTSLNLSVKANAYSHASPFLWVQQDGIRLQYDLDSHISTLVIDGEIDEVDGVREADFQTLWEPVTGHPDGVTYAYISNDLENLYISLDITMDNTNEIGDDFAEILIAGKTYRIDDFSDEYGKCGFGLTSKVSYKHQYCEFAIPRTELESGAVRFSVRYYGTGGGPAVDRFTNPMVSPDIADDIIGVSVENTGSFELTARAYDLGSGPPGTSLAAGDSDDDEMLFVTDSSGSDVFIGWGEDYNGFGAWALSVSKVTSGAVVSWTTVLDPCGGVSMGTAHCVNNIRDLIPDLSGGVFVLWMTGDDLGGAGTLNLSHLNSAGTQSAGFPVALGEAHNGDIVPDGSGGVIVLYDIADEPSYTTIGHGNIRRYTSAGIDVAFGTVALSSNTSSFKGGAVAVDDGAGGIVVFWVDTEGGEEGIYAQRITSTGAVAGGWSARGEQLIATTSYDEYYPMRAVRDGSNIFFSYKDGGNIVRISQTNLTPSSAWSCVQPIGDVDHDLVTGTSGVYAIWEDSSPGGNGVYAQHFAATTGHSTWQLGGELVDDDDSNGGSQFDIVLNEFTSSTGDFDYTPQTTGARSDGSGGVNIVYSYDTGSGNEIYEYSFDTSEFAAGPGGDCNFAKPPTKNFPDDASYRNDVIILSADYENDINVGVTNYRVSSSSAGDCLTGTNIVDTGSSSTTSTINESTEYTVSTSLSNGTYYWCAQNDDSTNQSAWTTMGTFTVDDESPYIEYASHLGTSGEDELTGFAIDGTTVYMTGVTNSSSFPTTIGAYDEIDNSGDDIFLSSFSLDGTGAGDLNWSTYFGGNSGEAFGDHKPIAFSDNAIWMAGTTASADLPVTGGAYDGTRSGTSDAFFAKFSSDGTTLQYSTYFGGTGNVDSVNGGVMVSSGMAYLAGATNSSTGFPVTTGAYDEIYNGGTFDHYAMIINPAGGGASDLVYSTFIGSPGTDSATNFTVFDGDFYIGGTGTSGYPVTAGAYDGTVGSEGVFSIITPAAGGLSDLVYSTAIPVWQVNDVAYNTDDNTVLLHGSVLSASFTATSGAYDTSYNGGLDAFVAELSPAGGGTSDMLYFSYFGGDRTDYAREIRYYDGSVYILGASGAETANSLFPISSDAYSNDCDCLTDNIEYRPFLAKLTLDGNGASDLDYSTYLPRVGYNGSNGSHADINLAVEGTSVYVMAMSNDDSAHVFANNGTPYDVTYNGGDNDGWFAKFTFPASGGGGGGSPAPNQNPIQVQTQLATPITDGFTVLGTDQVQYNFTFPGTNQNGFNIYDQDVNKISTLTANQRQFILEDLDHNTEVSSISIRAFNTIQESNSASWESAFTHIIPVTPRLISRNGALELGINEEVNNLEIGDSGIQFELLTPESPLSAVAVEQSEWSQTTTAIFNPPQDQEVQVRVRARNQVAVETEWSQYITVPGVATPEPEPEVVEEEIPEPEIPEEEIEEAPGDEEEPAPPLPPTEDETETIDNILTEIIDDEVEQITPEILPEPEPDSSRRVQTRSQSDGRSFTVEVEDEGNQRGLVISGLASTDQRRIEFTGTTSVPESTVTLIFNQEVTVVVSSDAEGFWQTFVSAEQLGIPESEAGDVTVEAIAAKDDLVSDRVSVGAFRFAVTQEDEVIAEFDSVIEDGDILTAINSIINQANDLIKEQEETIQTTLTVTAPVVVISSAPLWGYLPYFPTLIYHFITYLIGLLGKRKQEEDHLFGQVYDSITKKPLGLAVLRIYEKDSSKLIATKVTDKLGRYDLLLEPGEYRIEVKKPQYAFPSTIVSSGPDGEHTLIYNADTGILSQEGGLQVPDIPIDPIDAKKQWSLANMFKKLWLALQKAGHYLAVPVLFIGAIAGAASVAAVPTSLENWLIAGLYIFLLALQLRLRTKLERAWGVVYDLATAAVLPLTTIQLIDPEYGKVVKSRLTDYEGRFTFLPEPGNYIVKASKPGYEQTEVVESGDTNHKPISGEVAVKKEGQRIDGDIAMRQL